MMATNGEMISERQDQTPLSKIDYRDNITPRQKLRAFNTSGSPLGAGVRNNILLGNQKYSDGLLNIPGVNNNTKS